MKHGDLAIITYKEFSSYTKKEYYYTSLAKYSEYCRYDGTDDVHEGWWHFFGSEIATPNDENVIKVVPVKVIECE